MAYVLRTFDWGSINVFKLFGRSLRLGVLVAFVALGETFSQRAGVINIGVEGVFLSTCCVAAVVRSSVSASSEVSSAPRSRAWR